MIATHSTMTRDEVSALVQDLLSAARRGDLARVRSIYADDAVAISPMFGEVRGGDAIAETWATLFSTFDDFSTEISHVLVDGDRVAVLSTVGATDRFGWRGRPPTGGPIRYKLVLLFTVAEGRIVRDERIYDSAGVVERLEKVRLDKELKTAADVQRMLLARTEHVNAFSESAGDSVACRAIGGDFFEIVEYPSGDVGLALGDVAGKGPAAALLASMLQGMLTSHAHASDDPAATLTRINRDLADRRLEARFATLVYAVLSPDGRLVYANAGHNPPALVTRGGIERLSVGGPVVGAFRDAAFEHAIVHLQPNDRLVMFTDGVTEARNAQQDEFGEPRLLARLQDDGHASPRELLQRIFADVRDFCRGVDQSDDITVTVTRYRG
jgi:sigma-B regulation protein RsbU (phosphoserine phosphatase)